MCFFCFCFAHQILVCNTSKRLLPHSVVVRNLVCAQVVDCHDDRYEQDKSAQRPHHDVENLCPHDSVQPRRLCKRDESCQNWRRTEKQISRTNGASLECGDTCRQRQEHHFFFFFFIRLPDDPLAIFENKQLDTLYAPFVAIYLVHLCG